MSALFSLMLIAVSHVQTPQPVRPFPDVPKTHWAYSAVTELHDKGILKGYPGKYDRSTPQAAFQSLLKAINNDDKAIIQELTTPQLLENWRIKIEDYASDTQKRTLALKLAIATWKQWARSSKFSGDV